MTSEEKQRLKNVLLDLKEFIEQDPDDVEELERVDEALALLEGMKDDGATGKLLTVGCDVVHPESGEVLAETDDTFRLPHPAAERVIAVAKAYPHFYIVAENANYVVIADAMMAV